MKTLVWTRSIEDWASDEALLAKIVAPDIAIDHVPCIKLQPVEPEIPQTVGFTHAVFTSPHAVAFAFQNKKIWNIINQVQAVYTHGAATADALTRYGITATLVPEVRTAETLGAWLDAHLSRAACILLPGPRESAFDLAGFLGAKGFETHSLVCYETATYAHAPDGMPLAAEHITELKTRTQQVVCFASPSAVRGFVRALPEAQLACVAIGPTTAEVARLFFPAVQIAEQNTLPSLVGRALTILR